MYNTIHVCSIEVEDSLLDFRHWVNASRSLPEKRIELCEDFLTSTDMEKFYFVFV